MKDITLFQKNILKKVQQRNFVEKYLQKKFYNFRRNLKSYCSLLSVYTNDTDIH